MLTCQGHVSFGKTAIPAGASVALTGLKGDALEIIATFNLKGMFDLNPPYRASILQAAAAEYQQSVPSTFYGYSEHLAGPEGFYCTMLMVRGAGYVWVASRNATTFGILLGGYAISYAPGAKSIGAGSTAPGSWFAGMASKVGRHSLPFP